MNRLLLLAYFVIMACFNAELIGEEIALRAEYQVDTVWATAYQVSAKLTNQTNKSTETWTASFTLPQENQLSSHYSGGIFSINGKNVTVKNLPSNGSIGPGSSVTFDMIINMPQKGRVEIDQLVAKATTSSVAPPAINLSAPVLKPILSDSLQDYTVSWSEVPNATTYYLEVDTNSNFNNPKVVVQENINLVNFTNQPSGTYFYRVAAGNSSGKSPYSNVQSIVIAGTNTTIPLIASYKIDAVWAGAFQTTVTLTNNTSLPVKGWKATLTLPVGFALSNYVYSGIFTAQENIITVINSAANLTILPNSSVTFSMIINKPSAAKSQIDNLQALGNVNSTSPLPIPAAPVVQLKSTAQRSYIVSWNSAANAVAYILQEDIDSKFSQPKIVAQGNVLSQSFSKEAGTYYYRVLATNAAGNSAYSNVVSIVIKNENQVPSSRDSIEHSIWYIDWTSWFTGPSFVIPKDVNMINIFVGELTYGSDGKPTMGGFGTFTLPQMEAFVQFLAAQAPPIRAKVSIGGGGGMYDRTWDKLTPSNIKSFAQGMVDFCHRLGLAGVDFDYEAFSSSEQEVLVGTLIREFKLIDPNLEATLCSNAGFGPSYPWQQSVKNILDAAIISPGNSAVDRFYVMSYFNPMSQEIAWLVGEDGKGGWTNWLISNYGFTRARISVGINRLHAPVYDPEVFKAWALKEGFSIANWAFDPARP